MAQWASEFHNRRRTLFPTIPDPFPMTHRKTFTRTASGTANQTLYYVHGAKCATPGTIHILPTETITPGAAKRRAVRP